MQIFFLIVTMTVPSVLLAQEKTSDSTRTYQGKEVEVKAKREQDEFHRAQTISTVKINPLESLSSQGLAHALAREAGVFVRQYGALGALALGGVRGFSGDRTIVVRDGVKLNNPANGIADFSMIALSEDDDVHIQRGGASAEYGADAMGGAISIDRKENREPFSANGSSGVGSFGYLGYGVTARVSSEGFSFNGSARTERAVNDYEYYSPILQSMRLRTGADARITSYKARVSYDSSGVPIMFVDADASVADRGVPGADLGTAPHRAREYDNIVTIIGGAETEMSGGTLSPTLFVKYAHSHYSDSSLVFNGKFLDELYDVYSIGVHTKYSRSIGNTVVKCAIELVRDWARAQTFFTAPLRNSFGTSLSSITPFEISSSRLSLEPAIRFDAQNDIEGGILSPKFSCAFEPAAESSFVLRASIGQNFRSPTFNDFYWYQGGNPSLKPERSTSGEAGISYETNFFGRHLFRATIFASDIKNYIQWYPSGAIWRPRNVARVVSHGAEIEWKYQPAAFISLQIHYTHAEVEDWTDPSSTVYGKQLINQPRNWGGVAVIATPVRGYAVALHASTIGERFSGAENKERDRMSPFVLFDVSINGEEKLSEMVAISSQLSVANLFDSNYQFAADYPMPGRDVRIMLQLSYSLPQP